MWSGIVRCRRLTGDMMQEIQSITEAGRFGASYRGFIFDLDDTLYNEKDYVRSGYHAVAVHFRQDASFEKMLWDAFLEGKSAFNHVLPEVGMGSEEMIREAVAVYREHDPELSLAEDVRDMLLDLMKSHKVGIITDGRPEGQKKKIRALGLDRIIEPEDIVITDLLGGIEYRKPNPKAYQLLQQRWNTEYSEMVYIGDNPAKDFLAPEALGMGSIRLMNKEGLYWDRKV